MFPPLNSQAFIFWVGLFSLCLAFIRDYTNIFPVNCEYSNEHNEHCTSVQGQWLSVTYLTLNNFALFCIVFAIPCRTNFFLFGHSTHKSFMDLHVHQTVLQLPPLMSFLPPPRHCYSVRFSLCRRSRCNYCHVDIVPCPQHLLETLCLHV